MADGKSGAVDRALGSVVPRKVKHTMTGPHVELVLGWGVLCRQPAWARGVLPRLLPHPGTRVPPTSSYV